MKKATAQIEFSMALTRVGGQHRVPGEALGDDDQRHDSQAAVKVVSAPVIVPSWGRMIAHCAAKQISATVATDRPTRTLDSQWLNRQMR